MATLTIRNVPDDVVERIRKYAADHGKSMEQAVRELLEERYPSREDVIARIRERKKRMPKTSAKEIREWAEASRRRTGA